jgi:WD40 repeat protein
LASFATLEVVSYAEFSPDGRRVATASSDFSARVWNARTGEPLTAPMPSFNSVAWVVFSPDGERLVTCIGGFDTDGKTTFHAQLWETATGRALGRRCNTGAKSALRNSVPMAGAF